MNRGIEKKKDGIENEKKGLKKKEPEKVETLSGGVQAAIVVAVAAVGVIVGQLWNSTQMSALLAFVFGSIAAALFTLFRRKKTAPADTLLSVREVDPQNNSNKAAGITEKNDDVKVLNRQLEIAHNVIKMQSQSNKLKKLTGQDFEKLIEPHRFDNGRLNMTKAGRSLNVSKDTIRREIKRRKLGHIVDQPKSK